MTRTKTRALANWPNNAVSILSYRGYCCLPNVTFPILFSFLNSDKVKRLIIDLLTKLGVKYNF